METAVDVATGTATQRRRVPPASPYEEIVQFLFDEATLLDEERQHEWLELLTNDISYRMPVRRTVYRRDGRGFDERTLHFNDDRMTLGIRVRRNMDVESAFDRDPAPRYRRLVTNVLLYEGDVDGEYVVTSSLLLLRNSGDNPDYDLLSAQREDVVRRTPDGLRLASRTILVDQARLNAPYPNVFL
jgi:3-phenylpropionate/cinnamic acid dioxygenase small subunit